jgi:hypothetical protein
MPVAGLACNGAAHLLVSRFGAQRYPYYKLLVSAVVGLVLVIIGNLICIRHVSNTASDALGYMLLNVLAYLALSFDYFSFSNLCLTSLRIRMLQEIRDAGGQLDSAVLRARYGDRNMVALRLDRLLRSGHLVEKGLALYAAGGSFYAVARLFQFLRWLIIELPSVRRRPQLNSALVPHQQCAP